jgi:hypothetical protein
LLGADIADDLIPAQSENILGYWESATVIRIHDDLLNAIGCSKDDPLDPIPFPAGWDGSHATQCAKRRIVKLIERDFAASSSFVVKDPRISRLLPVWIDVLRDMHIEPVILIPFRNPLEVAASLAQRASTSRLGAYTAGWSWPNVRRRLPEQKRCARRSSAAPVGGRRLRCDGSGRRLQAAVRRAPQILRIRSA